MTKKPRFLLSLIFVFIFAATVFAAVDTSKKTSLTVRYSYDKVSIDGAKFGMYRVADISSGGRFSLAAPFNKYQVSFDDIAKDEGRALAETLAGYVQRDAISPLKTAVTDKDGVFTVSELATGMYLVIGDDLEKGNYTYMAEPFLISLPNYVADQWTYDVTALPKSDRKENPVTPPSEKYVSVTVRKVWVDDTAAVRPSSIKVQLLKDDSVYDTAELNAAGQWSHTWDKLPEDATYRVTEANVPNGYTVSVDRDGNKIDIINKYEKKDTPPGGDVKPSEPTTHEPTTSVHEPTTSENEPTTSVHEPDPETTTRDSGGSSTSSKTEKKRVHSGSGTTSKKAMVPPVLNEDNDPGDPDDPNYPNDPNNNNPNDPNAQNNPNAPNSPDTSSNDSNTSSDSDISDNPNTTDDSDSTSIVEKLIPFAPSPNAQPTLPQTGQLWWPVPIMAIAGVIMLLIGSAMNSKKGEKDA